MWGSRNTLGFTYKTFILKCVCSCCQAHTHSVFPHLCFLSSYSQIYSWVYSWHQKISFSINPGISLCFRWIVRVVALTAFLLWSMKSYWLDTFIKSVILVNTFDWSSEWRLGLMLLWNHHFRSETLFTAFKKLDVITGTSSWTSRDNVAVKLESDCVHWIVKCFPLSRCLHNRQSFEFIAEMIKWRRDQSSAIPLSCSDLQISRGFNNIYLS